MHWHLGNKERLCRRTTNGLLCMALEEVACDLLGVDTHGTSSLRSHWLPIDYSLSKFRSVFSLIVRGSSCQVHDATVWRATVIAVLEDL
ncbi:hypothetical protein K466DRAFT_183958 [Polyporus arcularius HHB13444]|uniref:Uncharacterized protein n=1 Tax=Polyporus arcularius HHB13444 TaxID=1314778 RepID=A0A5C3P7D4_9APHY|nr:hypothetical protein K466DRAFT_183958 [Polyporus arcularius HHB13444]